MKLTFKYVRRQALQARCHCNLLSALDGRVLYGTVCGFLFENLFFVCYSQKVLFSTRPMLENKQTCAVKYRGVYNLSLWVCGSSPPFSFLTPRAVPEGGEVLQQGDKTLGLSGEAQRSTLQQCQKLMPVLEPALHLPALTAGQYCWEVTLAGGQQPQPLP